MARAEGDARKGTSLSLCDSLSLAAATGSAAVGVGGTAGERAAMPGRTRPLERGLEAVGGLGDDESSLSECCGGSGLRGAFCEGGGVTV